MKSSEDF